MDKFLIFGELTNFNILFYVKLPLWLPAGTCAPGFAD